MKKYCPICEKELKTKKEKQNGMCEECQEQFLDD